VNKPRLVQQSKAVEKLLGEYTDKGCAKAAELVLLDQLVQVHAEKLEYQAQMLLVDEGVL